MDFLKKHYEKLILSLVLLSLAAVAVLLFVQVGSFRENLDRQLQARTGGKKKELKQTDLSASQASLKKLSAKIQLPLGGDHPVFNAIRWRKTPTGDVLPDLTKTTQGAAGISDLVTVPLYLSVDYVKSAGGSDSLRYEFLIGREFEKQVNKRSNLTLSARVGEGIRLPGQKSDLFRLLEVKGPPAEPTELEVQFTAGNERAVITPRKPHRQVMGYSAQFVYGTEKRAYKNIRAEDTLQLSGTPFKVVAVTQDEFVIAAPNLARSTIKTVSSANP